MRKINLTLALLFLSLLAVSCQKEDCRQSQSVVAAADPASCIHITYWIDGTKNTIVLNGTANLSALVHRLSNLAVLGHQILISNDDAQPTLSLAKEIVKFNSKDQKEFEEWMTQMLEEGYDVSVYYDEGTGIYYGEAIKK